MRGAASVGGGGDHILRPKVNQTGLVELCSLGFKHTRTYTRSDLSCVKPREPALAHFFSTLKALGNFYGRAPKHSPSDQTCLATTQQFNNNPKYIGSSQAQIDTCAVELEPTVANVTFPNIQ